MRHEIRPAAAASSRLNPETSTRRPEWWVGCSRLDKDTCGHRAGTAASGARLLEGAIVARTRAFPRTQAPDKADRPN